MSVFEFFFKSHVSIHAVTTDSTSEDDTIPPPLPAKSRELCDYSNLPPSDSSPNSANNTLRSNRGKYKNKPLPAVPLTVNQSYDYVEPRRPPTPPPKPSKNIKKNIDTIEYNT